MARHGCQLDLRGVLRCWGENQRGQLGAKPSHRPQLRPTPVPDLPPVAQAALGVDHTCALLRDGSVECFGGAESQHARADARGRVKYQGLGEIVQMVAGLDFTCARNTAREVHCWGAVPGELEPVREPKRVADLEATRIAASRKAVCAVRPSGSVACWGDNHDKNIHNEGPAYIERPTDVAKLEPATDIAMSDASACALLADRKVACWGGEAYAWWGSPREEYDLTDAIALTAGLRGHFCALKSDETIKCWGDSKTGATGSRLYNEPAIHGTFINVRAGADFACATRSGGGVECWGSNDAGQLAQPFDDVVPNPSALASTTGALAIGAADRSTCVVLADKTARCFGQDPSDPLAGNEGSWDVSEVMRADALIMGGPIRCLLTDGLPTCWGDNRGSQLISQDPTRLSPQTLPSLGRLKALAFGPEHACSLSNEGAVKCWGGAGRTRALPTPVPGLDSGVSAIALGADEGCALLDEGSVACFPLRDPPAGTAGRARFSPKRVTGTRGAVALAHGRRHACAVDNRGGVVCWGTGGALELGRARANEGQGAAASEGDPLRATPVAGIDEAVELALGDDFSCARRRDGTAWCWGENTLGQLGDSSFEARSEPRPARGLRDVVSLRAGSGHACALTQKAEVLCWGDNRMRQIRQGALLISTTGVPLGAAAPGEPKDGRAP